MSKQKENKVMRIPIVIPAYEPDDRLLMLLQGLSAVFTDIILVNDGSDETYDDIFDRAEHQYGCIVLKHYRNMGKGRSLKDAFNYCLNRYTDLTGCVTADSDGQHTKEDIVKCIRAFEDDVNKLVLGCRNFNELNVPAKSRYGNKITCNICGWLCGIHISDTQTGLRVIPKKFMADLLNVSGERFEFETNMLIETKNRYEIREIPIETIYDSKENHQTHFHPVRDSIRIYSIFGKIFLKYIMSSLSSCLIDLILFNYFCLVYKKMDIVAYIAAATACARIISSLYNFAVNYRVVFNSKMSHRKSASRYFMLVVIQMACSAALVSGGKYFIPVAPETLIKVFADTFLFFVSYWLQRKFVF